MAGKVSAKGAVIAVDDSAGTPRTISTDCVTYEIEYGVNPEDVTGFGDGSLNYIPGQIATGVTLEVLWDTTATTGAYTVLKGILASATSKTLSITPEAGGQTFSGEFMLDGIKPAGAAAGSPIKLGSCHFSVMGAVAPAWA